jgi:phospholipid-binding lipoprotein MlaA
MMTTKLIANYSSWMRAKALFCLIFVSIFMMGCASSPKTEGTAAGTPASARANADDPIEPVNRAIFGFNEVVDKAIIKPVATGYRAVTPSLVRQGVSNVFSNLSDVWSIVNLGLQGRGAQMGDQLGRVMINSLVGLGGIFDVAGEAGIDSNYQDFGQTLGRWGVGEGAYVVLPLFGPSTVRDAAVFPVNSLGDPVGRIDRVRVRNSLTGLRLVETRSNLLRAGAIVDEAALDKYSFIRDAYLQRRRASIGVATEPAEPDAKPTEPTDKK